MAEEIPGDEKLVKSVLRGDTECFRILVERYQDRVYSTGMRLFRNSDDARDYTQEVFIRVYNRLDSFRGNSPFRYWLMKVAYNHGINMLKKIKDSSEYSDSCSLSNEPSPHRIAEENDINSVLREAVDRLPEKYRICVDLYFYSGFSYRQICEITGFPENTIKSHVYRAKNILRQSLRGSIAEEIDEL